MKGGIDHILYTIDDQQENSRQRHSHSSKSCQKAILRERRNAQGTDEIFFAEKIAETEPTRIIGLGEAWESRVAVVI